MAALTADVNSNSGCCLLILRCFVLRAFREEEADDEEAETVTADDGGAFTPPLLDGAETAEDIGSAMEGKGGRGGGGGGGGGRGDCNGEKELRAQRRPRPGRRKGWTRERRRYATTSQ